MAYLILGAAGQLGRAFRHALGSQARPLSRTDADLVNDQDAATRVIREVGPVEAVINCVAFTNVDAAEGQAVQAFQVNALFPRWLAGWCGQNNLPLVHFSTDYVFGNREPPNPWRETDIPCPVNAYGVSKLAGELFVRAAMDRHLVIRTSTLAGHDGPRRNFVESILAAPHGATVYVPEMISSPTFAADLVAATLRLLGLRAYGLFHVTNSGYCSRLELARTACKLVGRSDLTLLPHCPENDSAAIAHRAEHSVLVNEAAVRAGLAPMRHWTDALRDYLAERERRAGVARNWQI